MLKWSGFGALGAGFGVAVSSVCCLPFAAALGAGVAAAGAVFTPLQPYLALASVSLLLVAFVQTIRAPRCEEGGSCRPRARAGRWWFLAAVTVATVVLLTLPYWSAGLIYGSL